MSKDALQSRIEQFIEQLREEPGNHDLFRSVEGILVQNGDWKKLAEVCEHVAGAVEDTDDAYKFLLRAANLFEEKLELDDDAARCFNKASEISKGDAEAVLSLIRVRKRQGNFPMVVVLVSNHVGKLRLPRKRVELLLDSAKIRREQMDDPAGATADLKRALVEDPNYPGFLDLAAEVFEDAPPEYGAFLEDLHDSSVDPVVRREALEKAMELYRELGDFEGAIRCQERALEGNGPESDQWVDLIALFAEAEEWDRYSEALERERLVLEHVAGPIPKRLLHVLNLLGDVYDSRLHDHGKAIDVYRALLRLEHNDEIEQRVQQLLAVTERWEDLIALHLRRAERNQDFNVWRPHMMTAASLCEEHLESAERATKLYERILARSQRDADVLKALCRLYETRERWADLAVACVRYAAVLRQQGQPDEARTLVDSAASVYEFRLSKPGPAADLYEQILDADPTDELAADALLRVRRTMEDPGALVDALARVASATSDPNTERDAQLERGTLFLDLLDDLPSAELAFRAVLELGNENLDAWHYLQETLRRVGSAGPLLEALDAERALVGDDDERTAILQRESAQLLTELGRSDEARARWEAARELAPHDPQTLYALLQIYDRADQVHDVADVLRALASANLNHDERAVAFFQLSQLIVTSTDAGDSVATSTELAEAEGEPAAWYARKALDLNPEYLAAITYVRQCVEEDERWEEAVILLQREAALTRETEEKADLLHRAAEIRREGLDDEKGAAALDASAVAVHPNHLEAARPLADWYYRHDELAEAEPLYARFGAKLALEATVPARGEALYRYAIVLSSLKKEDEALMQLQHAVDEHPAHQPALELLAEMRRERAEWEQARDAYLAVLYNAMETMDTAKQVEVNFALARIGEATENREEAIQRYNKVIGVDPSHARAARALIRLYTESSRWKDAVQAYEILLPNAKNKDEETEIYLAQGELLGGALGDWDKAVFCLARAVACTPERVDVREAFARGLRKVGKKSDAAKQYGQLAKLEEDRDDRIRHYLTQAEICEEIGDADGARAAYEGALSEDPQDRTALGALASLYEEAAMWKPLVDVLRATVAILPRERKGAQAELHLRAAKVLVDRMNEAPAAAQALRQALDVIPDHRGALEAFALLMSEDARFDEDALNIHHRLLASDPLRTASLRRLAQAYARHGYSSRAATLAELLNLLRPHAPALPGEELSVPGAVQSTQSVSIPKLDVQQRLLHPAEDMALTQLLHLIDPFAARLYPPDLEAWGQPSTDSPDATQPAHIRIYVDAFARALGVGSPEVHFVPGSQFHMGVECTDPPTIVAGDGLLAEDSATAAYDLARAFLHIAAGRVLYVRLDPRVFDRLMLTVVAFFVGQKETPKLVELAHAKPEDFTLLKRSLPRRVQRKARDVAGSALGELSGDPLTGISVWRRHLEWSSHRAALLLTGDVLGTLQRVLSEDRTEFRPERRRLVDLEDDPGRLAEQIRSHIDAYELAKFVTTVEFLELQENFS